ncbi:sodium-independent sulfate anion transporter-like [Maniola hyperantus]|uniref:sodium-independent sulfate anion transporter-like n=1 Tax=Aphantopus hyperantus TaxID=2795564 RepID=UPI001568E868|nr:sodium-independent sulfate anion transporter-like [Maniola hyperantus]
MEEEEVPFPCSLQQQRWRGALGRRLPVLRWAPRYDRVEAVADAVAGITLGLTLVPQSIAYASLANLPVQYGLYSAFVGTMLYVALGTVKEVSIGPTSLMALLTLHTCRDLPVDCVVLLTFLAGCLVLLMGLLRLGFLVDLISPSVTIGFTSATAVIIVVAQLKGLLGLSFVAESPFDNVRLIVQHWGHVRLPDCALAAGCCAVLLALRKLKDLPVGAKRHRLKKLLWLVSIARNALVVLGASTAAYCTYDAAQPLFKLSGKVESGLPKFGLPPFSTTMGNQTLGFFEMVERLGSGLAVLPLVMVLANIAIAKAFTVGGRVDATQEMLTLGVCNIVGAFVRAMPTCGAFTRSAVSHSSGVRTPAAGLYSGIITLLALNYLTQYFFFIPKACLSSVLICAVVFMIDVSGVIALWRSSRREACVALLTLAAGVTLGVEAAVLGGALASLAVLLRDLLRPPQLLLAKDKASGDAVLRVRLRRALVYVNAEHAAAAVRAALASRAAPEHRAVLVDCGTLALLDHTAVQVLERLIEELEEQGRHLVLYDAGPEALKVLQRVRRLDARALAARSLAAALALAAQPPPRAPAPAAPETLPLLDKSPAHEEV